MKAARRSLRGCLRSCETTLQPVGPAPSWCSGGPAIRSRTPWPQDGGSVARARLDELAPALAPGYPPRAATVEPLRLVVLDVVREHQRSIRAFHSRPRRRTRSVDQACWSEVFWRSPRSGLPLRLLEIVERRPQRHPGSLSLSSGRGRLRRSQERRAHCADLGRTVAADRRLHARVIARRACDISPIDLEDAAQRLRLRAYVWPDQHERLLRLENAVDLARAYGPGVERA